MNLDAANIMDGIKGRKKKRRKKMSRLTHEILFPSGVRLKVAFRR